MLKNKDYLKLLHDLKRVAKILPFVKEIDDHNKRAKMVDLLQDELDRLVEDLEEAKSSNGNGDKE